MPAWGICYTSVQSQPRNQDLPDPMVDVTEPDYYLPFDKAFNIETGENDLPSLQKHKKRVISYLLSKCPTC